MLLKTIPPARVNTNITNSGGKMQPVRKKNPDNAKQIMNAILKPFIMILLKIVISKEVLLDSLYHTFEKMQIKILAN